MVCVEPQLIQKDPETHKMRMVLVRTDGKASIILYLPDEEARVLALELQRLATDRCAQHELTVAVAAATGVEPMAAVLKGDLEGYLSGALRLIGPDGRST